MAFIQSTNNTATSAATCVKAYGAAVTPGNLLVVASLNNGAGPLVSTVSDSVNGTWTKAKAQIFNFSTKDLEIWYFPNTAAGTPTVTVTYTAAPPNSSIAIAEYSGVIATSPLDKTASAASTDGTGGTSLDSGNTASTTVAMEVLIGAGAAAAAETFTAGTSYTIREQVNNAEGIVLEDQFVLATGAYKMTATDNSSQDWGAIIATFKMFVTPELERYGFRGERRGELT